MQRQLKNTAKKGRGKKTVPTQNEDGEPPLYFNYPHFTVPKFGPVWLSLF